MRYPKFVGKGEAVCEILLPSITQFWMLLTISQSHSELQLISADDEDAKTR